MTGDFMRGLAFRLSVVQGLEARAAERFHFQAQLKAKYGDEAVDEVEGIIQRINRETPYCTGEKFRDDLYDLDSDLRQRFVAECLDGDVPTWFWGPWVMMAREMMTDRHATKLKARLGIGPDDE